MSGASSAVDIAVSFSSLRDLFSQAPYAHSHIGHPAEWWADGGNPIWSADTSLSAAQWDSAAPGGGNMPYVRCQLQGINVGE